MNCISILNRRIFLIPFSIFTFTFNKELKTVIADKLILLWIRVLKPTYDLQRSFNPLDEKLKLIQFDRLHLTFFISILKSKILNTYYFLRNTYYIVHLNRLHTFYCHYVAFILPWCWEYPAIWNCLCYTVNVIRFFLSCCHIY